MDNSLLHYKTYEAFKKDLDAGLIKDQSVTYIKDKKIIYTHGTEYCGGSSDSGTITADVDPITVDDLDAMGFMAYEFVDKIGAYTMDGDQDYDDNVRILDTMQELGYNMCSKFGLERTFAGDGTWETICLPVNLTWDEVRSAFGSNTYVDTLQSVSKNETGGWAIQFVNAPSDGKYVITAGMPYLICPSQSVSIVEFYDKVLYGSKTTTVTKNGVSFIATYGHHDFDAADTNYCIMDQGTIGLTLRSAAGAQSFIRGTRCYFKFPDDTGAGVTVKVP